jgi:methylmalonyl-CoA epimerase
MGYSNSMDESYVLGIEEIAIAVKDADKGVSLFNELFGFDFDLGWELLHEKIRVKSQRIGETQFQLLESITNDSVVARFIEKKGEGLNHIAFRVCKLKELVAKLKRKGVHLIPDEPVVIDNPVTGEGKLSYIFVHPKSALGILIELIEY